MDSKCIELGFGSFAELLHSPKMAKFVVAIKQQGTASVVYRAKMDGTTRQVMELQREFEMHKQRRDQRRSGGKGEGQTERDLTRQGHYGDKSPLHCRENNRNSTRNTIFGTLLRKFFPYNTPLFRNSCYFIEPRRSNFSHQGHDT